MLVLSRESGDSISFPELDLALKILKVHGSRVQIGISAPEEIRVLRTELLARIESKIEETDAESRHQLRNRLNAANLALTISQKHLERGDLQKAEMALRRIVVAEMCLSNADERSFTAHSTRALSATECVKSIHILLIEDNLNEARLLAEILEFHGISVEQVHNGIQAIESLHQRKPDAILMDMNMPDCDGPTTIRKIRTDNRFQRLPIYAVSGASQSELGIHTCRDNGVDDWFQKPVQSRQLLERLKESLPALVAC